MRRDQAERLWDRPPGRVVRRRGPAAAPITTYRPSFPPAPQDAASRRRETCRNGERYARTDARLVSVAWTFNVSILTLVLRTVFGFGFADFWRSWSDFFLCDFRTHLACVRRVHLCNHFSWGNPPCQSVSLFLLFNWVDEQQESIKFYRKLLIGNKQMVMRINSD